MINVHGRQVLYLLLGDVEPDAVVDARHRADRDRDFPAAPQVSLLEKDVGHVAGARVGDKPLQEADVAVGGMDMLAAAHSSMCGRPDRFRTVRDLGLVSPGCPGGSGSSQGCSSAWLPAWLPAAPPAGTTSGFQEHACLTVRQGSYLDFSACAPPVSSRSSRIYPVRTAVGLLVLNQRHPWAAAACPSDTLTQRLAAATIPARPRTS